MTHRHDGTVAVVTGGSSGIGEAIVQRLAVDGARVAVLDTAAAAPDAAAMHVRCDVGDPAAVTDAVAAVTDRLGAPAIVVHSAVHQFVRPFDDVALDDWRRVFRVNVEGAVNLIHATLPAMRAAGWGRYVVITSSTFVVGAREMTAYVASKGALVGLVRSLASEIGADGITINAVAPGLTRTPATVADLPAEMFEHVAAMQAIPRTGLPHDHAGVVAFLCSDEAAFMTGQTLLVDGGQGHT